MPQSLELLTHRTDSLHSIRGIVRTMKTLSAINAQPYEQAALGIEAYLGTVLQGLQAFVHHDALQVQQSTSVATPVIIVLGSDHGLCGNYNELLADEVSRQLDGATTARIICVGAQIEDALKGLGMEPEVALFTPSTADGLGRLAGDLVTRLDSIRIASPNRSIDLTVVFTRRGEHGRQCPIAQQLLPLDPILIDGLAQTRWPSRSLPQFTLPAADLLAALIRSFLFAQLFRAAAEALVTENAARLARMQQAEQSVDEQLDELTMEMRTVRQNEITAELLDVIIGFEALKGRKGFGRRNIVQSNPPSDQPVDRRARRSSISSS